MGLLSKGTPLDWHASLRHHAYVKHHGILQFLAVYAAARHRTGDDFLWGDEVEHLLIRVHGRRVQLSLRGDELIERLQAEAEKARAQGREWNANFLPEYGRFMIEATPARPYGGFTSDLRLVERNMRARRAAIEALLHPDERVLTLTAFPLMGTPGFAATSPEGAHTQGFVADSEYIMDEIIAKHPRFATLTRNIRTRRGCRVDIRVPLFQDKNTARDIPEAAKREREEIEAVTRARDPSLPPHMPRPPDIDDLKEIHMDAMSFGMGQACVQVTFQTRSINEARHLYDHLAVLSPIMLALTAATPFFRGRVGDIDVRWTVISQAVDCRTKLEKGGELQEDGTPVEDRSVKGAGPYVLPSRESNLNAAAAASCCASSPSTDAACSSSSTSSSSSCSTESCSSAPSPYPVRKPQRLYKSRYDSISSFISLESDLKPEYNDIPCEIDEPSYRILLDHGIDELLARHVSHLFIRDPLVIFDEHIYLDDNKSSDHFENLQSTNWQTVRFKPPPAGSNLGWRVEFRTMEVQLTDFENAAFTVFIALVSRALLYFKLNFYIPLSKVDENLKRAHERDAINQQKFFWRRHLKNCPSTSSDGSATTHPSAEERDGVDEISIRDIMLGSPSALDPDTPSQPGLINLVRTYLDVINCDDRTRTVVDAYLDLISRRASGELMTTASWLRKFVEVHPSYQQNSLLNQEIVTDLVETCNAITKGDIEVPQLLGSYTNKPMDGILRDGTDDQSGVPLRGAESACAIPSSSDGSSPSPTSSSTPVTVLDLNERNCCEKLRVLLQPYIQSASRSHPATPQGTLKTGLFPTQFSRAPSSNTLTKLIQAGNTEAVDRKNEHRWSSPPTDSEQPNRDHAPQTEQEESKTNGARN